MDGYSQIACYYNLLTGRNPQQIKAEVAEKGDLGLIAEASRSTQRTMFAPPPLTISGVFNKFTEIAKLTGHSVSYNLYLILLNS